MTFQIGFSAEQSDKIPTEKICTAPQESDAPRASVVQVSFAGRNGTLAYFNDQFDLHCGDVVFVDGKLEGQRGRVEEVSYNFKIKTSDYKHVIAVADTRVCGQFCMAGSHFVTFNPTVLPAAKARLWFMPPVREDETVVSGYDDSFFLLEDLHGMKVSDAIAERGHDYYRDNRVQYLCMDGTSGYAIVEGGEPYEVEFTYRNGEISSLTCSCFCSYNCKHEFAAMLQLRETLETIGKHYAAQFERSGYFAAICKGTLFTYAVDGNETGEFTL